jgi:LruC domain-containing protein
VHTFKLSFDINSPTKTTSSNFPSAPYDPFIFNAAPLNAGAVALSLAKTVEIHLPGKKPTSRADLKLFGTQDDATKNGTTSSYYKSARGLPWALDIPNEWAYPFEQEDVVVVYPNIVPWATSGGSKNLNWYVTPSDVKLTFLGAAN